MAVRIALIGSWMLIENADPYISALERLATFNYVKFLRSTWPRSQKVVTVPRKCYIIEPTSTGKRFACKSGLLGKIKRFFESQNIEYEVLDTLDPTSEQYEINTKVLDSVSFRDQQRECIEAIINARQGLVQAPTGLGKTFIIAVLAACWHKAKIAIIARSREVVSGIRKECERLQVYPGIVCGSKQEYDRVTVYTAGSLHKADFDVDIVLADECHELVTPRTLPHLYRFKNARMFGFSATINTRSDNAHFHLYEIFGDIIFKMTFVDAVKRDLIVPIAVQWINVPEGAEISKDADYVRLKKQGIWRNEHRNRIIADIAKKYFNEGRQVLILVETVDHAINLKHLLPEFVVCAADIDLNQYEFYKKRGYEVQDVLESIHKRDELKEKFKSRNLKGVIATNIWSAGVSFDDLEVLIRADGRVSKTVNIQAPGRVCRIPTSVDKEFGIVVDFIDRFDVRLYKRAQRRFQYYKQMGWFQCNENWEILRSLKE